MRAFWTFLKKELLESARNGRLLLLLILFCVFGIMNPAVAKLTPWLLEVMGEELAENGMVITSVNVDALTSWAQFFKNIPMALIAFVLVYGGIFTKEYESGTLILVLTKGISRYKVFLGKATVLVALWSAGYWLCFGITYAYNEYFWDNGIAQNLLSATLNWWLFGLFVVALVVFVSVFVNSYGGVLLGTGGCVFVMYLLSVFSKIAKCLPTSLMGGMNLLAGAENVGEYTAAAIITAAVSLLLLAVGLPAFNKKQL